MEYVTLTEAAELEGIKYEVMKKRIQRSPESFSTKTEKTEGGGRDQRLLPIKSLSKQARAAWKERQKLKELTKVREDAEDSEECTVEKPWYVDADLDWYMENYRANYYKGVEQGNIVREFLRYGQSDRTLYAETYAQEHLGKSARTLYRMVKAYMEADAWAQKMEKETGASYEFCKVLCLCRKPKETGTFPSMSEEVKHVIKNIWFNKDFAANRGTREMLYEKLGQVAAVNGWEKLPSYQTVVRYIQYLMEDKRMKNAHFLAERGVRDYRNRVVVKAVRDTRSLKVMEIVMGDEHTFDCWVAYREPNGRVVAIRPKLVVWIDVRSRRIMGTVICKDANGDILKESLLKLIYKDAGSVPQYLMIDNGKDYTKEELTGVHRNQRFRADFQDTVKGFYQSVGIEGYQRAAPYESWVKGQIERSFRTVCNRFTKWFASYTGTLTGSKTSDKVPKDIQGMLEQGKLLTMEEFYARWDEWLEESYHQKKHAGLKEAGEIHLTPKGVFDNEERYFRPAPPREYATMLMLKSEKVHVYPTGIKRFGYNYMSEELTLYINENVDIKYDPNDITTLYVFWKGKRVCEAYSQELLRIAPGVHQEAVAEHKRRQRRQEKRDREILEAANVPLEQLNAEYQGFQPTAGGGGIELMISAKRAKAKVVSMPSDPTYRDGFRATSNRKTETEESEYLKSQAKAAMEQIRAMNQ